MSVRYSLYSLRNLLRSVFIIAIISIPRCVCEGGNEDVRKAVGYLGEQVVLKLDVDPAVKLTSIKWSIYRNITLIAVFKEGFLNIFRERFTLNNVSGDLTIANVKAKDALKYRVDLEVNGGDERSIYVELFVHDQVSKPNIIPLHSFLDSKKCVISLKCFLPNSTITLSWKSEQDFTEHFCSDGPNVIGESVMWTSLRINKPVSFTCIATDGKRNESRTWSGKCPEYVHDPKNCTQKPDSVCTARGKGATAAVFGIVIIIILLIGIYIGNWCLHWKGQYTKRTEDNRKDETTMPPVKSGEGVERAVEAGETNNQENH